MPLYHVHFATDAAEPYPPVSALPSVEADNPPSAVEALLAAGRFPQRPDLRWARVVTRVHENGIPASAVRFPIHVAAEGARIDWELPGSEF